MRRIQTRNFLFAFLISATLFIPVSAQRLTNTDVKNSPVKLALPVKDGSVRFAVIGDTGSGTTEQRARWRHDGPVSRRLSVRVCLDDGRQLIRR